MVRYGISATSANLASRPNGLIVLYCWMVANLPTNQPFLMSTDKRKIDHFISEPITIHFDNPPLHPKSPPCPNSFTWQERPYKVIQCLAEWHDFSRRGRMARNMQPQHATSASKHGSWGVGRFYFDVETADHHAYRLYYDRSPKDAMDRYGHWVLLAELNLSEG